MVVLEITSESARTNMPVNGAESALVFMVLILALKFIVDWQVDSQRQRSQQFTDYQNQIKKGIDGYGAKNSYN